MSVVDLTVSGIVEGGETVISALGKMWRQGTNSFGLEINDFVYINSTLVGVAGLGEIAVSTDGGETFGADISNNHTGGIFAVESGDGILLAAGKQISKSANNGATWSALIANAFTTNNDFIYGLAYDYNSKIWVAVGEASTSALYSIDAGATWTAPSTPPTDGLLGVSYVGNSTFVAVTQTDGNVWISTDSGDTWAESEVDAYAVLGWSVAFGDGVVIAVFSENPVSGTWWIYRSVDRGQSWVKVATETNLSAIRSAYEAGVFFCGWTSSRDGGQNFARETLYDTPYGYPVAPRAVGYDPVAAKLVIGDASGNTYFSKWLEAGAGIVEQGSNANGEYVIFSSGLQICWQQGISFSSFSVGNVAIGTFGWSYYHKTIAGQTFPAAFASAPFVAGSTESATTFIQTHVITATSFANTAISSSSATQTGGYIAIGQRA